MGQVSLTLPSDGTTIEAADVNNPFNTLLNEFNGNIDDNNIKSAANINGTKLLANSIPPTAFDANARAAWRTGILPAPNTVTALGNRSYSLVFNSTDLTGYISAGMRLRTTRTATAPNQCTSLNGSTQYYNKASPAGTTFTDDFVTSAWIKLSSYQAGTIISRYNGTSGWAFQVSSAGQFGLVGYNAGAANFVYALSQQSLPLNKWVHVAAQLDMSAFTATTTTCYLMLDGVDIPVNLTRGGTNPAALVQPAADLQIGAQNSGTFFAGKIAQVAYYSAKVTQATILASMHQTLVGTETSLVSAYSFNNTINDLNTTNANNLTANGSAVATNADSPYGGQVDGTISTTLDYGIVVKTAFSTNTTLTVQVPDGCTIPTSGGVSAVAYSGVRSPYGFPGQRGKWEVTCIVMTNISTSGTVVNTTYNPGGINLNVPIGEWNLSKEIKVAQTTNATGIDLYSCLSTSSSAVTVFDFSDRITISIVSTAAHIFSHHKTAKISLSTATPYYVLLRVTTTSTAIQLRGDNTIGLGEISTIRAECAYL